MWCPPAERIVAQLLRDAVPVCCKICCPAAGSRGQRVGLLETAAARASLPQTSCSTSRFPNAALLIPDAPPLLLKEEEAEDGGDAGNADMGQQDDAPQAHQGQAGLSHADDAGSRPFAQPAGGAPDAAPDARQARQRQQKRPEPNPLRSLGDALERWKQDLSVAHEAPAQPETGVWAVGE